MLTIADIIAARERIAPYILHTPLLRVPALDDILGCEVYLKPENLQDTGSFKLRGATNCLSMLTPQQREHGVITASSGNHAKGVACAAARFGTKALVIMPTNCNPAKLSGVRSFGATVLFEGTLSSQRNTKAAELVREKGYTLIHSHIDERVIAGQGTIGLEILEDNPSIDAIVSPVGGGGLISGVATAVKAIKPVIRVIGAEPSGAARYAASRAAGHPVMISNVQTIADGTRCDHADPENFKIIERLVDTLVDAGEDAIRNAVQLMAARAALIAEPSAVLGIAAALSGRLPVSKGERVCFILSGGNNDPLQLAEILASLNGKESENGIDCP